MALTPYLYTIIKEVSKHSIIAKENYVLSKEASESKDQTIKMKKGAIKLSSLAIGKSAVITSFEKDDLYIKLMEMGCVPGETVKIEKIAPLGDPISIMVAGYNLSLRKTEADFIWVEELI